ncbi:hypothetical protein SteCoe_6317 [Stentor coeruleus]|uniref:Uncharacterized protein n=1 Tax=Stentor coeruleus TaxID=5963 RepID=A0A1R2CQA5_9CILI|nr:hypothetical protein SteCoe_6317 [Stentor coeruleus]
MEKNKKKEFRSYSVLKTSSGISTNKRSITPKHVPHKVNEYTKIYNDRKLQIIQSLKTTRRENNGLIQSKTLKSNTSENKFQSHSLSGKTIKDANKSLTLTSTIRTQNPGIDRNGLKKNIVLDTLKAKSDYFELRRDMALFEHNFVIETKFHNNVQKLKEYALSISASLKNYHNYSLSSVLPSQIYSSLLDEPSKVKKKKINAFKHITETFSIPCYEQISKEKFSGFVLISNLSCLLNSESFANNIYTISCQYREKTFKLLLERNMTTSFEKNLSYKEKLLKIIVPSLWFDVLNDKFKLNSYQSNFSLCTFAVIRIKGLGQATIQIFKNEVGLVIQIPNSLVVLNIENSVLNDMNISTELYCSIEAIKTNLRILTKVFERKIMFCTGHLLWLQSDNPFEVKEIASSLMNDNFLLGYFKGYLKKIFHFQIKVKGCLYRIVGFENFELKIEKKHQHSVRIYEGCQEYTQLISLQTQSLLKCPNTLKKSLELRELLVTLFKL